MMKRLTPSFILCTIFFDTSAIRHLFTRAWGSAGGSVNSTTAAQTTGTYARTRQSIQQGDRSKSQHDDSQRGWRGRQRDGGTREDERTLKTCRLGEERCDDLLHRQTNPLRYATVSKKANGS